MFKQSTPSVTIAGNRIEELESVRGVAALLVVFFHFPCWNSASYDLHILRNGYLMVELFFVLSGFVIYKAYAGKIVTKDDLFKFQFLRLGRLYPVHFFFLFAFLGIELLRYLLVTRLGIYESAAPFERNTWTAFLQQIVLIQAIGQTGNSLTFNYPAWSISVELYTYFLFGLIVLFFNQKKIIIFALLGLFSVGLLETQASSNFSDLLKCTAGFFIGCITAEIANRTTTRLHSTTVLLVFISTILFLQFKEDKAYDVIMYLLASLLILTIVLSDTGVIKSLLRLRVLTWLGTISYSVYMSHAALVRVFDSLLKGILKRPTVLIDGSMTIHLTPTETVISSIALITMVLLVSNLSYKLIEKPFRDKSRLIVSARSIS